MKDLFAGIGSASSDASTPFAVTTNNREKKRRNSKRGGQASKRQRTESVMKTQQKLFFTTMPIVFQNLEEEGHTITQDDRKLFDPKKMYEEALSKDIPWRQWNAWIRNKVINTLCPPPPPM